MSRADAADVADSADAGVVRTVLGDVPARALGRTDYHEHLLQATPLLPGDELLDVERSTRETAMLRDSGFDALVDLTPIGLGRDAAALTAIARATGVHVVAATGVHHEGHYPAGHPVHGWSEATLVDRFVGEIVDGLLLDPVASDEAAPRSPARAGVVKVGTGYWSISGFEARVLAAGAAAQARCGTAVVCHLELGSAAWEAAELLEDAGADRGRIVLAHADRNPDPELHLELIASGVTLGYDGAGRTKHWPDSVLLDCLERVVAGGGAHGLLLGGDVARRTSFVAHGGLPGMRYLGERFVPRLERRCGPEVVRTILVDNPARVLALPSDGRPTGP